MRITTFDITPVAVFDPPLRNAAGVHQPYALRTIIQLATDEGLVGVGETFGGRPMLEQLEAIRHRVVGEDPWQWERLRTEIASPSLFAPIECACLDLIGQATGRPVCDLLGGCLRERVEFSAYLFFKFQAEDPRDDCGEVLTPQAMVQEAMRFVREHGFRTLKLKGGVLPPDQEVETLRLLREAFPNHLLRIDPNAAWSTETAVRAGRAMAALGIEYLEDPVEGRKEMAAVRRETGLPLSTNMCVTAWEHIGEAYALGSVDVILADPHYWGGLAATKELGRVCQSLGWGLSMHSNRHLGVSLAAMLHAAAATPHLTYACDTHYPWQVEDVLQGGRFRFEEGALYIPTAPGLGVRIDPARLAQAHEAYLQAGQDRRDDAAEMKKYDPNWEPERLRW